MHKILMVIILAAVILPAQVYLRGNMGINGIAAPSMKDYLNFNFAPQDQQVGSFSSAIEFAGELGVIMGNYSYAVETAYHLNSYTYPYIASNYEFGYGIWAPSLVAARVWSGYGYNFKFGAGAGPRFVSVDETIPGSNVKRYYTASGVGFLLRAEGNTALSKNLFAYISAQLRYDLNGTPKNNGRGMSSIFTPEDLNMNMFSAGVSLGVSYQFE